MLRFKCCPRCVGDMVLERGPDGPEWVCLQCGFRRGASPAAEAAITSHRGVGVVGAGWTPWDLSARRFDHAADSDLGATARGRPKAA